MEASQFKWYEIKLFFIQEEKNTTALVESVCQGFLGQIVVVGGTVLLSPFPRILSRFWYIRKHTLSCGKENIVQHQWLLNVYSTAVIRLWMMVVGAMLGFVHFCATLWIMACTVLPWWAMLCPYLLLSFCMPPCLPPLASLWTDHDCVISLFSSVVGDAGGLGSPPGDKSTIVSPGQPPDHSCHLCGASGLWEREGNRELHCGKGSCTLEAPGCHLCCGLYQRVKLPRDWLWRWYLTSVVTKAPAFLSHHSDLRCQEGAWKLQQPLKAL